MSIAKRIISEIFISLFVGTIPLVITTISNDNSTVVSTLSTLNPGDPVVIYLASLLCLHISIWIVVRFLFMRTRSASRLFHIAHKISYQIGFTIHSIYRVITGAIPMAISILFYRNGYAGATQISVLSGFLVFGSLFMCCVLSWLSDSTAPKSRPL